MIVSVPRRHRTDRHGGMIERVRDYIFELGSSYVPGGRQRIQRRAEYTTVQRLADVQDYVHVLEGIVAGVEVSQVRLAEAKRRYIDVTAELHSYRHPVVDRYLDATVTYVRCLQHIVGGFRASRSRMYGLRARYAEAREEVCRAEV
jgi:hypothetical protein